MHRKRGGSIIIVYVHYVRAQHDIIVVVVVVATIQMKLVFKFCRFSNVTDKYEM